MAHGSWLMQYARYARRQAVLTCLAYACRPARGAVALMTPQTYYLTAGGQVSPGPGQSGVDWGWGHEQRRIRRSAAALSTVHEPVALKLDWSNDRRGEHTVKNSVQKFTTLFL